ncbi:fimbrial protein [Pseudomonas aeruginosa]
MKIRISAIAAAVFAIAAGNAMAADLGGGNIEFKGQVNADTCYVQSNTGDARTLVINMGTVNAAQIETSTIASPKFPQGAENAQVDFQVICKTATQDVKMALAAPAGSTGATTSELKVNNGQSGPGLAGGVGIAVYPNRNSTTAYDLSNGEVLPQQNFTAGQAVSLSLAAAYVKNGAITPGTANGTLPFVITTP